METSSTPTRLPPPHPAHAHPHAGRAQLVRLPPTTAELVNRMLAQRCGASR